MDLPTSRRAKLCLVVRQEPDGIQMSSTPARATTTRDCQGIYGHRCFTADRDVVADVSEVFKHLTGVSSQKEFRSLLVAPIQLRTRLSELITREGEHARAGREARIIIKVNAITDDQMIRVLYKAAQAGVSIDLIVRGICSLRPAVPGVSDNIRVRSVVGRFLEHSRIFWFRNDGNEEMYIGSADLMERNLDRRVETLTPVRDAEIVAHLRDVVLAAYLRDTDRAMMLDAAGRYTKPDAAAGRFNAMEFLLKHADLQNE